ncbi:MAG: alanine racemase [Deltaproteobacteria bacterium]|nr:alanine racemase [Deltaproteobacteria bacterium]
MSDPRPIRPTLATVDLSRLKGNLMALRALVGPSVGILAAVKGDAYGHGAVPVARALQAAGCEWFGVALVEEGIRLREAGIIAPILCLGGAGPGGAADAIAHRLTPVVYDLSDAERIEQEAARRREPYGIHLKVDTGMGRLGVPLPQWEGFLDRFAGFRWLKVDGLCSHLGGAGEGVSTEEQGRRFLVALQAARVRGFHPSLLHLANSEGAILHPRLRFDLVRPGLALYGIHPSPATAARISLEPVMTVTTRVLFVKDLPAGVGLCYDRRFVTPRPSRIATLPVGYADGYPRALSNHAEVLVHGCRAPVRGTVCMDLTLVDVTDVHETVSAGDEVVLLGQQGEERVTAEELARHAGTVPYEILCGFSERVPRRHEGSAG